MDDNQIKKIKDLLSKEKTIVIIPHKNPDGDAIGSSTALDSYLKKLIRPWGQLLFVSKKQRNQI